MINSVRLGSASGLKKLNYRGVANILIKANGLSYKTSISASTKITNLSLKHYKLSHRNYADKVVVVPQIADSINEGTLKSWSKQVGEYVEQDEEVATIETDKVDVPVNAPVAGTILEHFAKEEDTIQVGQDLFKISEGGEKPESSKPKETSESKEKPQESKEEVKEEAKEVKEEAKKESKPEPKKESKPAPQPKSAPKEAVSTKASSFVSGNPHEQIGNRTENRVKMNRMRLRIAERLKESQNTAASLTTFNEVDMSALMELRNTYKDKFVEKHGVKLGFMSAFAKASAIALQEIPAVNASIEGPNGGDTIIYRDYVDISVAVSTPKGLVTPVVRNVQNMDFLGIESTIAQLGAKARDNKITLEDLTGGTFTISNGGVFGSMMGTPIINMPQTAILGMHAIKERPVAIKGKVEIRPMMYLALTYDHRLVDGREAVTFLVRVKEILEDPRRLLLGL
ncbi:dihydrolipoamide succinyltransferase [Neoconidiobolus thromboides FSU 785]|nr:dihydrolipoamide succinyltransferase [Neoconidiobolus thromboides FSU 785]